MKKNSGFSRKKDLVNSNSLSKIIASSRAQRSRQDKKTGEFMAMAVEAGKESLRQKTQEAAKRHKASWIELGQFLLTIHKDKLYKEWGYLVFETYCKKELGIKETTAAKLLKSYSFLEKEEPTLASAERFMEEDAPKAR